MPQNDEFRRVGYDDDEIIIQAGCVSSSRLNGADSSHSFGGRTAKESLHADCKEKALLATTEEDLKQKVPYGRMRAIIIALAIVAILVAIGYALL